MGKVGRKADRAKGISLALHENTVLSAVVLSEEGEIPFNDWKTREPKKVSQEGDLVKPLEDESHRKRRRDGEGMKTAGPALSAQWSSLQKTKQADGFTRVIEPLANPSSRGETH